MHNKKILVSIFLCLTMLTYNSGFTAFGTDLMPLGEYSNMLYEPEMAKVMLSAPDNYELENSNALYTGIINTYSPQGQEFARKHADIANSTIREIEQFNFQLQRNKLINKQYYDNIVTQLNFWREQKNKYPSLAIAYQMEIEVFNLAYQFQTEEVILLSTIDAIKNQIDKEEIQDRKPANYSYIKSSLYSKLLVANLKLIEFYKKKYENLLGYAAYKHALQENPNLYVPAEVVQSVKIYHERELEYTKLMLSDLEYQMNNLRQIDQQSQSLLALFNEMDVYSLSEIKRLRTELEAVKEKTVFENTDLSSIKNAYIELYKGLEKSLEIKIKNYETKKIAYYHRHKDNFDNRMAYLPLETNSCIVYSGIGDWASSAYSALSTGVKTVAGAPFAIADYTTGKVAETYYTTKDIGSKLYDTVKGGVTINGVKEFINYTSTYSSLGDKIYTVSIQDTFIDPMANTLKGDNKNGLGQSGVNKAQGSFKGSDEYFKNLVGNEYVSDIGLNIATLGAYGFAKDFTTINDANATTGEKAAAVIGLGLALVPALSGANGAAGGKDALIKTVKDGSEEISSVIIKSQTSKTAATIAEQQLASSYQNLISKAGSYIDNIPSGYMQSKDFLNKMIKGESDEVVKQAFNEYKDTLIKNSAAAQALKTAQNEITDTVKDSVTKGFWDITEATIKGAFDNLGSKEKFIDAIKDHYTKTVTDAVKKDGAGMYLVNQSIDNLVNKVITDTIKGTTNYFTGEDTSSGNSVNPGSSVNTQMTNSAIVPTVPDYNSGGYIPLVPTVDIPQAPTNGYYPDTPMDTRPLVPVNPDLLAQYLQSLGYRNSIIPSDPSPADIDNILSMVQQGQKNFNETRQNNNTNNGGYQPSTDRFSTDMRSSGNNGGSITDRISSMQNQTQTWANQNNVPNIPVIPQQGQVPNNQTTNTYSNIPVGDGVPEQDTINGIDDDNDDVIDEGGIGNMEIAIHDTGGDKDDQWEVFLDGQSLGKNNQGKTRFWSRTINPGQHTVSAVGVVVPDGTGTYTVGFRGCSVVSGPSLTGSDLNNGVQKTWVINCQ